MTLETSKISAAYQLFYQAIINNSFQELATAAYSLLNFPSVVFDSMSNCLAQIPAQDIGDPDYLDTLKTGKTSDELFHSFSNKYFTHPETREYPLLIDDGLQIKQRQFLSALYSKGRLIGYTAILLMSNSYSEEDVEIIRLFNRTATHMLLQQESRNNATNTDTQLLHDILEHAGGNNSTADINAAITHLNCRLSGAFHIIVSPSTLSLTQSNHLCLEIMQTDHGCIATYYNNFIVVLLGKVTEQNYPARLAALQTLFKKYNLKIYISGIFSRLSLSSIQAFYAQALLTVKCAENNHDPSSTVAYNAYEPQQMFLGIKKYFETDAFIYQKIYSIQKYDEEHSTCYYTTLKTFLTNMKNYKLTAQQLYVHPNTISYRISRMDELFGITFEDEKENLLLLLSCLLLDA